MRINPSISVIIASVFVSGAMVLLSLPLKSSVATNRLRVDTARAALQRLEQQQSNIDEVSKNFETVQRQLGQLQELFVEPTQTVDLFNRLDALIAAAGLVPGDVRLDNPTNATAPQLIGIHLTATGTPAQLSTFLQSIGGLPFLVIPQTIAINADTEAASGKYQAAIDGVVAWDPAPTE